MACTPEAYKLEVYRPAEEDTPVAVDILAACKPAGCKPEACTRAVDILAGCKPEGCKLEACTRAEVGYGRPEAEAGSYMEVAGAEDSGMAGAEVEEEAYDGMAVDTSA